MGSSKSVSSRDAAEEAVLRYCSGCQTLHSEGQFYRTKRGDGLKRRCKKWDGPRIWGKQDMTRNMHTLREELRRKTELGAPAGELRRVRGILRAENLRRLNDNYRRIRGLPLHKRRRKQSTDGDL